MRATLLFVLTALIGAVDSGMAQSVDSIQALRREIDNLRRTQEETLREVREIRRILAQLRGPAESLSTPETVDARGPALGHPSAPVTIVEFSDYECPFCGRFFRETLPLLVANYVKTGRVRLVYRDFPLSSMHPRALQAAHAALCAGDQQRFWEYHDALFQDQAALEQSDLVRRAVTLKLDTTAFNRCLQSQRYSSVIQGSLEEGARAGLDGTPLFFIGRTDPGTTNVHVAGVIRGAKPYAAFQEAIEGLLSR